MRTRVIPKLGIDVAQAGSPAQGRHNATFSVWDVTAQEVMTKRREEITSDLVLAAVSPPMWFPPVRTEGHHVHRCSIRDGRQSHGSDSHWGQ